LLLAFFVIRLAGQCILVHIGFTVTARHYPDDAGKAVGVAFLGFSLFAVLLPAGPFGTILTNSTFVAGSAA